MKKLIVLFMVLILMASFALAKVKDNPQSKKPTRGTVQDIPILVRTVTANDTMLDNDTKTWAQCRDNFVEIPQDWSWLNFSIYAYDANNAPDGNTGTVYIYGCERRGGVRLLDYGNFTIGSTQLTHNPVTGSALNSGDASQYYQWADTYTSLAATNMWLDSGADVTGAGGSDPNGNIASIWIDRMNIAGVWADVNNVTFGNAGADLTSVTVIVNGGD